jgi:hypothetical protein
MRLAGAYRPPLGALGARLDAVIMNRVAAATMRSFVRRVAEAIVHPAAQPGSGPRDPNRPGCRQSLKRRSREPASAPAIFGSL